MSIYLQLFLMFFKIGLFTFGGGYAMIPLINQEIIANNWLTQDQLLNYIGISESTPGPFAINIATFVGTSQAGFVGAVCATVGVVLPSFVIILLIAMLFKSFSKNTYVKGTLKGIAPIVNGLILGTGIVLALKNLLPSFGSEAQKPQVDFIALAIMILIFVASFVYKKVKKKSLSPIIMILASAVLGMIAYSI